MGRELGSGLTYPSSSPLHLPQHARLYHASTTTSCPFIGCGGAKVYHLMRLLKSLTQKCVAGDDRRLASAGVGDKARRYRA